MTIDRNLADAVYRINFGAFTYRAFEAVNPGQRLIANWHIDTICYQVQQMVIGEAKKRLILNLPPRSLKSFIASVALPAWLLGRQPSTRIICGSYSDELATKFSRDRRAAIDWFRNTALSRLDEPAESIICLAMQRLHVDDLSGILIEQGWPKLVLPAIALEAADYLIGEDEVYHRPAGQLLQPMRDSFEAIEELKLGVGSRVFAAQYQQNPTPADGNMIKAAWLGRYDTAPDRQSFERVVLSCDPAGKAGIHNDYTAIAVVGVQKQALHVLEVSRGHWTVMKMREQIIALAAEWRVDLVIVEDTSSGMGLVQLLKEEPHLD